MTRLPDNLRGLTGQDLLEALSSEGDWRTLEAMWCYRDPALGELLVPHLLRSGQPDLVDVLVDEVIHSDRTNLTRDVVARHLFDSRAASTTDGAQRMLTALDDPALAGTPTALWALAWLFETDAPCADQEAIDLASMTTTIADTDVLRSAFARVGRLGVEAQDVVTSAIAGRPIPDPSSWNQAVLITGEALTIASIGRDDLIRRLLFTGAELPSIDLPPAFTALVRSTGAALLLETFSREGVVLGDQPGTGAYSLLELVDQSNGPEWQIDVAEAVAFGHHQLWVGGHQALTTAWDTGLWQEMLQRRIDADPADQLVGADALVQEAPDELVHLLPLFAAAVDPGAESGPASAAATERLRVHLANSTEGEDRAAELAFTIWPADNNSARTAVIAHTLVAAAGEDTASRGMAGACLRGALTPELLADVVPESGWVSAVVELTDDAICTAYVSALGRRTPESIPVLAQLRIHDDATIDFAVVEGLAAISPADAFDGLADRWDSLDEDDRNRLVGLLDRFSSGTEIAILDRIVSDSALGNKDRRLRACARWSQLAQLRTPLPPGVASLLSSNRDELRKAAADAVRQVCPRDDETLNELRELVALGGPIGRASREALDSICDDAATELESLRGAELRQKGVGVCRVLGLSAGDRAVALLAAHLGPDALDESLTLRRAAAAALAEVFEVRSASPAEMETIGGLLHGDNIESDVTARHSLETAHRRAELGEDAALSQLDEILGPNHRAADLVVPGEKSRLLDALQRMATRHAIGETGWEGYIAALDLVLERIGRGVYLHLGPSENLKAQLRSSPESPAWGRVIDALRNTPAGHAIVHVEVVHTMRCDRTDSHGADEVLTESDVNYATTAFRQALPLLHDAAAPMLSNPSLHVVDGVGGSAP